jgi:predicted lipoprotein
MIRIPEAVLSLYPEAKFCGPVNNGGYDEIRWDVKPDGIKKAEVETELARLQAEYDANQYQRDRQPEYPSMADQLDYIYHNGIAKWKSDMIKPVKDAHPKP